MNQSTLHKAIATNKRLSDLLTERNDIIRAARETVVQQVARIAALEEREASALDILLSAASGGLAVEEATDSELIQFIADLKGKIDEAISILKGDSNQ